MQWRTMEDAPLDGTEILIWDGRCVDLVRFTDGGYGYLGWHNSYSEREDPCQSNAYEPTHWMPLPNPPEST